MKQCKACNANISYSSTYCRMHFQNGARNNRYGKHPWNYIHRKEKYYCMDCSKKVSTKFTKRCQSCAKKFHYKANPETIPGYGRLKEKSSNWKGGKPRCVQCNKLLSAYHVKRCKGCEDKLRWVNGTSGIQQYIKKYGQPIWKRIQYKGIWMRSSWEIKFAKVLDSYKVKWLYESKIFKLRLTTYTPDFYLPETSLYIEIKGFFRLKSKQKIREFKRTYSKIKFMLIDKHIYLKTIDKQVLPEELIAIIKDN